MSPYCDLDLKSSKAIFLHDIPAHYDASPYQVWSEKIQWYKRYHVNRHSLIIWTSAVPMTLYTAVQYYYKTLQLLKSFRKCSFSLKALSVWNSLLASLRNLPTLSEFKTQLTTFLFRQAFSQNWIDNSCDHKLCVCLHTHTHIYIYINHRLCVCLHTHTHIYIYI